MLTMQEAAMLYARRGWALLPMQPMMKTPMYSWSHNGIPLGTANEEVIQQSNWADQNIWFLTGQQFDIFDIDLPNGPTFLAEVLGFEYEHPGPEVLTPRGGRHLYFQPTGHHNKTNMPRPGNLTLPKTNLDYRGVGGGAPAPPSRTKDGQYCWVNNSEANPIPEATDWLLEFLRQSTGTTEPRPATPRDDRYKTLRPDILAVLAQQGIHPGRRGKIRCLFHDNRHEPSMTIDTVNNRFKCFACGAFGDSIDLIAGVSATGQRIRE